MASAAKNTEVWKLLPLEDEFLGLPAGRELSERLPILFPMSWGIPGSLLSSSAMDGCWANLALSPDCLRWEVAS